LDEGQRTGPPVQNKKRTKDKDRNSFSSGNIEPESTLEVGEERNKKSVAENLRKRGSQPRAGDRKKFLLSFKETIRS